MATKKYLDLSGLTQYDTKIKSVIPSKTSDLTNDSGFITDSKVVVIEYGSNIEETTISNYLNNGYAVFCKYTANNIRNSFYVPLCRRYYDTKPAYVIFEGFYGSGNKCISIKCEFTTSSTCTWSYNEKDLQEELVSGTNIKTINNQSLLGSGNISISGGSATDVQINGTSIVSNDVANITTSAIANLIYPVGSIYMSVNSTSPATLFGGTWQQIKDTFLLACGDTYSNGATGGSADAVLVSHNHTTTSNGAHTHEIKYKANGRQDGSYWRPITSNQDGTSSSYTTSSGGHSHTISTEGESGTGKNMPPYLAVYMWQRTA